MSIIVPFWQMKTARILIFFPVLFYDLIDGLAIIRIVIVFIIEILQAGKKLSVTYKVMIGLAFLWHYYQVVDADVVD